MGLGGQAVRKPPSSVTPKSSRQSSAVRRPLSLQALRSARIGRQNRRRKVDALGASAGAVANARAAHRDRTDAGHDFAFRQMPMTHEPLAASIGELVGMTTEAGGNLCLDRLRYQPRRCAAPRSTDRRISLAGKVGKH